MYNMLYINVLHHAHWLLLYFFQIYCGGCCHRSLHCFRCWCHLGCCCCMLLNILYWHVVAASTAANCRWWMLLSKYVVVTVASMTTHYAALPMLMPLPLPLLLVDFVAIAPGLLLLLQNWPFAVCWSSHWSLAAPRQLLSPLATTVPWCCCRHPCVSG